MTSRRRLARAAIGVSSSLSLLIGAIAAFGTVRWIQLRGIGTGESLVGVSDGGEGTAAGPCTRRPCNYLLLGSDSRSGLPAKIYGTDADIGGDTRADTIMLVHLDPVSERAVVLSFPRDLWVRIPHHGFDRINTAFEGGIRGGGPQLMAETVANLTHLSIEHYLFVDLQGFRDVVDTIGGVDMCIPAYNVNTPGWVPATKPGGIQTEIYVDEVGHIVDPNAGLDVVPGCQRLEGAQALAYVRARHLPCDHIPDFARIGRQQQFLRALINQMLRPSKVVQAPALVPDVLAHLRRDRDFLPSDLVYLVGQLRGLGTGAVEFRAVPGVSAWQGDKSVVEMDPSAERLFSALRQGRPIGTTGSQLVDTPPSEANTVVAVIDADSGGKVDGVERILSDAGFDVTPGVRPKTERPAKVRGPAIVFGTGAEAEAQVVAAYFPNLPVVGPRDLGATDVAIVVTSAYEPVEPGTGGAPSGSTCPAA
jgi:anionic cell wall polymer biosynthesis LytR-Cps2A-Psr (LCP) family protein